MCCKEELLEKVVVDVRSLSCPMLEALARFIEVSLREAAGKQNRQHQETTGLPDPAQK